MKDIICHVTHIVYLEEQWSWSSF